MKLKKFTFVLMPVLIAALLVVGLALADDGAMFRHNVSKTPEQESGYASMGMMHIYVPAQTAAGELTTIEYVDAAGVVTDTRTMAKPLIAAYTDDMAPVLAPLGVQVIEGGVTFGLKRDAFAAVSFDDGATWKDTNLSRSADLSSFTLANGTPYAGDVHNMPYVTVEGRTLPDGTDEYYVMAAWLSKYCAGGTPTYTLPDYDDIDGDGITETEDIPDLWGVAGSQGSVDYTLQGHPEVGEIPYSCVWTARGSLEVTDDVTGTYEILWRKPERLTSGRRDANVVAVAGTPGAGFSLVWQEDPEGLRPGQGLGPGEGWSGAIVNQKTDMWYSYISWDAFDDVVIDELDPDAMPKVAQNLSMPVRLTDNNMCKGDPKIGSSGDITNAYCYEDFNDNGVADFCAERVSWTNPGGTTMSLCQTEDGRVLQGRTGASRTRMSLQPYSYLVTDTVGMTSTVTSAWVVMAYEETKAMGDEVDPETLDAIEIGKNVYYHSFDMFKPDLVAHGMQLNAPAKDPETGLYLPMLEDDFENEMYDTEIARRFALAVQPPKKILASQSGTSLIAIFKQGIVNQGGPADIMLRRFVIPDDYDATVDNPYAPQNMACTTWSYTNTLTVDVGTTATITVNIPENPNYPYGLCMDPAINLSGVSALDCDGSPCPELLPLDGEVDTYPRVTEWLQTPENLDDESWEDPFDVSKGHRGFIDGDFVMLLYAWAPNWKQNTVGNDHYNLYVRRSFDGGLTWTTTPANYTHWDGSTWQGEGTSHCENYGYGNDVFPDCQEYGPGEFEQAWNVSQLVGNKVTVLDPRYTPSAGPKASGDILTDGVPLYPDDDRDPSKFFVVYETGDNTTVAEGEAVPLDLFYSRGSNWGDVYDNVITYYSTSTGELKYGWDWLENQQEDLSGEACVWSNPAGTYLYAIWNQWREDEHENIFDSDSWFRRVMYIDDEDSIPTASILYVSATAAGYDDGVLTFVGAAKDNDRVGTDIIAFKWTSNIDGDISDKNSFTIPASSLTPGPHTITFSAKDNEGNWSNEVTISLFIAETLYQVHLPSLNH